MTQREPTDPSRLLKDLESIRTLLDEEPGTEQMDIPLLDDIITSGSDKPVAPPAPAPVTLAERPPNPFLPYESLARLAGERVQLERLLQQNLDCAPPGPHTGAREVRLEARLQSEAQLVMQDVIDEMLPIIEAELRKRLSGRMEQLVREQLSQHS